MYKDALKLVTSVLGEEETNGDDLNQTAGHMFEEKWRGVRASDQLDNLQNGYYIANLDTHKQPGSHWVALAVEPNAVFYFDSFARPNESTLQLQDPDRLIIQEANPDIVQPMESDSCGQRCIAWLMMYDQDPARALDI